MDWTTVFKFFKLSKKSNNYLKMNVMLSFRLWNEYSKVTVILNDRHFENCERNSLTNQMRQHFTKFGEKLKFRKARGDSKIVVYRLESRKRNAKKMLLVYIVR